MADFFEKLIDRQLALGRVTDEQGDVLRTVFSGLSVSQREELQKLVESDSRFEDLMVHNIAEKLQAVASDDPARWQAVVENEAKELEDLFKNHADS